MLKFLRKCQRASGLSGMSTALAVAGAATLAGCSADIARFDLGYSEGARAHPSPSAGMSGRSTSSEYGSAAYDLGGYDRSAARSSDVARSDLPPPDDRFTTSALSGGQSGSYGNRGSSYGQRPAQHPSSPSYGRGYDNGNSGYGGAQNNVAPAASYDSNSYSTSAGGSIQVQRGDTLYSLSRRHGVSVNDLMQANGLTSSDLQPGQQLALPSGASAGASRAPQVAAVQPMAPSAQAPADWTGSYTVQPGDSLYAIARQNGVSLTDLERYNGIQDLRRVRPGTRLRLPGGAAEAVQQVAEAPPAYRAPSNVPPARTTIETRPVQTEEHRPRSMSERQRAEEERNPTGTVRLGDQRAATPQQPQILNGAGDSTPTAQKPQQVARAPTPGSASDAVSPSSAAAKSELVAGSSKLRWPVMGKVVGDFGPRPDGTHNDGVNLAAPMGTDVHAAEGGVVAYAGDELKGYGNLVLVRHDNGWVTAYAHAEEILVKRGDRIRRGQVIAKVGRTGQVDQPQLHFELRQGQKPVDPTPFMERI